MRAVVRSIYPRRWMPLALAGVISAGLAGCSSETHRFDDSVFASPYRNRNAPDYTGSVSPAQPAPVQQYSSQPLPPPTASRPATVPPSGQAGGGAGMASYTPAAYTPAPAPAYSTAAANPEVTGSVQQLPPPPPRQGSAPGGWNWEGGTAVVVGPGETVDSLSRKYGVPAQALMQANGVTNPAMIQPGQRIVIPRYNYSGAPAQPTAARAPQPAPVASAPRTTPTVHVVKRHETLTSIARHYGVSRVQLAAANSIVPGAMVRVGDRLVIPGRVVAQGRHAPPAVAPPRSQAAAPGPQMAAGEPTLSARMATPAADATEPSAKNENAGGAPAFRWPVRGRVITGFGAKPNGQQNDGINLSVPEGTAVRAAEDGVVAYAGSELKGYGNLILIRHSNGFVTAYAHASEIMVKRNDEVRRGQVIAKSGQSGTVTSPQLHFEIRKGATPVDPMQFLPAG